MIRVFLTNRIDKVPESDFLRLAMSKNSEEKIFGNKIETKHFTNLVEFIDDVRLSDYIMLRHDYFSINKNEKYIKEVEVISKKYNKAVIVFACGNGVEKVKIKNSVVLRTSQYKSLQEPNEIIVPPFVEDLGLKFGFEPRMFNVERIPVVGFVGTIFSKNLIQWIWYVSKRYIQFFLVTFKKLHSGVVYEGIYFRRKVVSLLKKSHLVEVKLFMRETPSAMKGSDFVLCMKGKGNYSSKFFETLSLGRIPIFVDTDTALPLENEIDYDAFILRVNHDKYFSLPKVIDSFWKNNSSDKFLAMQSNARQAFKYRLSPAGFYRYLFTNFEDITQKNPDNF